LQSLSVKKDQNVKDADKMFGALIHISAKQ